MGALYPPGYPSFEKDLPSSGVRRLLRDAARFPYILRWGNPDLPAPQVGRDRLLDIGAGSGALLAEMQRKGWKPWGVETDEDAARTALDRLEAPSERVFVGPAEEAEFEHASFDLVVLSHVVEHLHDPKAVLLKVRSWLVDDGILLLRCPNIASLESRLFGRFWFGLDVPRHLSHFSKSTLYRMLQATGFVPITTRPQLQASSLSGSILHLLHARRPAAERRERRGLYHAVYPLVCVLSAFGYAPCIEVTARPRRAD